MSAISTILARLRAAIWAIDVRDDIANAIEQCYSDVSNPTLRTEALEAALQTKIDEGKMAALTIGDGTLTGAKFADGTIPKAKLDPSITFDADAALDNTSTNAIQNKVVAAEFSAIKADLEALESGGLSLKDSVKQALLACFAGVSFEDSNGQALLTALYKALYERLFWNIVRGTINYTPEDEITIDPQSKRACTSTYLSLNSGDVVGFYNDSDYETYKFAIAPRSGNRVNWSATGGTSGYVTSDFTLTVTSDYYYALIARADDGEIDSTQIEYLNKSFGVKE